jgi:hypothetical protein
MTLEKTGLYLGLKLETVSPTFSKFQKDSLSFRVQNKSTGSKTLEPSRF